MCTKPMTAKPSDGMYSWTWEILQSQLLSTRRAARANDRLSGLGRSRDVTGSRPDGAG
jgi:hypothetical protein